MPEDLARARLALRLEIRAGADTGFLVIEEGEVLAAFGDAAALCGWLEDKLRHLEPRPDAAEVIEPPRIVSFEREAKPRRSMLKAILGGNP